MEDSWPLLHDDSEGFFSSLSSWANDQHPIQISADDDEVSGLGEILLRGSENYEDFDREYRLNDILNRDEGFRPEWRMSDLADGQDGTYGIDDFPLYIRDLRADVDVSLGQRDISRLLEAVNSLVVALDGQLSQDAQAELSTAAGVTDNWSTFLDVPGDNQEHREISGRVNAAVTELCERLSQLVAEDPAALQSIEWRDLEKLIALCLQGLGFKITITPSSGDGGKDVIAECMARGQHWTFFIEVKHWRSGKRVGSSVVQDFIEVVATERVDGGLILASSGFTAAAFTAAGEIESKTIRLGNETKIVTLCQLYTRHRSGLWTLKTPLPELLFERTG